MVKSCKAPLTQEEGARTMSSKILAVLGSLGSLAICMARFVASGKRSPHAVVTKQEPKIRELTHPARQTHYCFIMTTVSDSRFAPLPR